MYIYREEEYRHTIELLKKEMDDNSKKPLDVPVQAADETLELEGGLKLEL